MTEYDDVPGQLPFPSMEDLGSQPLDKEFAEKAKLAERLRRLQEANAEKYQDLLRQGARPDPMSVIMLRMNTLLTMLTPDDKLRFDIAFEEGISGLLDAGISEMAQRKLMTPGPQLPPPGANGGGLFIPGR